jgi:sialate O-acetylesterase
MTIVKQTHRYWPVSPLLLLLLPLSVAAPEAAGADQKGLPKQDVVDVPAVGSGLCVANAFQSNMVLQRDKPLRVWGWADPGEEVTVLFAGQEVRAKAGADRAWEATLLPTPASDRPQALSVKGKRATVALDNVLVGDVWVLGGQSNMEFPIANVDDGELEIASANFPEIRLLTVPQGKGFASVRSFERLHEWSDWSKRHFRKGDWDVCSPETVRDFSAIGYVFGRRLHMASGVPIGLIDASIGGTTVETWTPEDVLAKVDGAETRALLKDWADRIAAFDPQKDLKARVAAHEKRVADLRAKGQPVPADSAPPTDLRPGPAADRNRPGHCYAGVIRPLRGLAVAGAVFHQGFNNALNGSAGARMYYQVFGEMIGAWRDTFGGDLQMPFCVISLPTAGDPQTPDNFLAPMFDAGPYVREAQHRTFLDLRRGGDKGVGFVSSSDLRKSWYHPQIKIPLGERAAKWALVARYGLLKGRDAEAWWLPPVIEKAEAVGNAMRLAMSTEVKTADDSAGRMLGFAVAGKDRRFYPAEAGYFTDGSKDARNRPEFDRRVLVLRSRFVPEPVHYRYAWARNPMGNVVNERGVALPAQRSDDWVLEETPLKIAAPAGMADEAARRFDGNRLRKELERDDLERRVREAEATVADLKPLLDKLDADRRKQAADAENAGKPPRRN